MTNGGFNLKCNELYGGILSLSFTPGFSQVFQDTHGSVNRLNGFQLSRGIATWLKPGVNETTALNDSRIRVGLPIESANENS